ncbi:hypothetical protein VT06_14805 [Arsukibacterium sp. MJ3]|uniref:dTDP-4-dehydrorhamnose reductase n=1 Tax=Arsukibacterium sp. MJ3 TaxID=1632859 RepID=UPI000627226A|nr:dTDP-4-dehydrorhamnose reductase [Arsukibacterium sp. MJ3]KKO47857.1 hypothetical protein VT06_14805 [Arsukibacterium sp. MJ3]
MMHLLITGANGQLGQCFAAIAKQWPQCQFTFVDSKQADITNPQQIAALVEKINPYAIINCAAYTNVDLAEQQPELAYAINATAVKKLAQLCRDTHTLLIQISTDYVFNGKQQLPYRETDVTAPINQYGQSKLAGEQAMLSIAPAGLILRTSWLYSEFGHNFVRSIWRKSQQGQPLQVVDDQIGSPTYARELATLCLKLVTAGNVAERFATPQLLHCAGQGQTSWYQLAQEIMNHSKQQVAITPLTSKQWQGAATRPAYSALNSQQLLQQMALSLPPWQQSLASCLNKMGQSE